MNRLLIIPKFFKRFLVLLFVILCQLSIISSPLSSMYNESFSMALESDGAVESKKSESSEEIITQVNLHFPTCSDVVQTKIIFLTTNFTYFPPLLEVETRPPIA